MLPGVADRVVGGGHLDHRPGGVLTVVVQHKRSPLGVTRGKAKFCLGTKR
jgi:hypothetical protein